MTSTTEPITATVTDTTPALGTQVPESVPTVANAAPTVPEATPTSADTPETATAPSTATGATVPSNASSSVPPPEEGDQGELLRLLRELLVQQEKKEQPQPPAKPLIGKNNLIVEGLIKVSSDDGIVVNIPINAMLPGALSPAVIQMAHLQFEAILNQLVTQPAMAAFNGHLDFIQTSRKAVGSNGQQPRATAQTNGHHPIFKGNN